MACLLGTYEVCSVNPTYQSLSNFTAIQQLFSYQFKSMNLIIYNSYNSTRAKASCDNNSYRTHRY